MSKLKGRRISQETAHAVKGLGHQLKAFGASVVNGATGGLVGGATIKKERAAADKEIGRYEGQRARRKALENIERKQKGGSAAIPSKRADAGGGKNKIVGGAGGDRLESGKRTVDDKYDHATSAPGKRLMKKADEKRTEGKFSRGLGLVSHAAGGLSFATGNPITGTALLTAGSASLVKGHSESRQAEDLRLKSRGVDSLVNKARTGNTLGVNLSAKDASAFASASHKFHTVARSTPPEGMEGWQNVGAGRRGFGNPNNQEAAQKARKAKGLVK